MDKSDTTQKSFIDEMKLVLSGASAVVIGLAWKDFVMHSVNSISPALEKSLRMNKHLIGFLFTVLLTIVLGLAIHALGRK